MNKSSKRFLKILEVSVWGLFLLLTLLILNSYLQYEELLFYENNQKKIILGSSWGKSLTEIARICELNMDDLEIKSFNEIYVEGEYFKFKENLISKITQVPIEVDNSSAKLDFYFFKDQLFLIFISHKFYTNNKFLNLIENKYGDLQKNCERHHIPNALGLFSKKNIANIKKDIAALMGREYFCLDSGDIFIDYEYWLTNPNDNTQNQSTISLTYKPLVNTFSDKNDLSE